MSIGGPLAESIPEDDVKQRLASEGGTTYDLPAILEALRKGVGWYRRVKADTKTPAEIRKQLKKIADGTAALIEQLKDLHPTGLAVLRDEGRGWPGVDLPRLQAAAILAYERLGQPRRGPARELGGFRELRQTYQAILSHSQPMMSQAEARSLAADLLQLCEPEMRMPTDKDELRAITG